MKATLDKIPQLNELISLPSSKLRNTGCPVTSKQCIHKLGPNEDPWGEGGGEDSRLKVTGLG